MVPSPRRVRHPVIVPADRVAVIIGSTRPTRIAPGIAQWSQRALSKKSSLRYELVDLAEINLPFLDEPLKPALRDYRHEHTREWSALISGYQGFVIVSPQYNWGYPAPLKADWQLIDVEIMMLPYAELIRRLDTDMVEALEDSQEDPAPSSGPHS
jgi:hypothetical protein